MTNLRRRVAALEAIRSAAVDEAIAELTIEELATLAGDGWDGMSTAEIERVAKGGPLPDGAILPPMTPEGEALVKRIKDRIGG